VSCGDGRATQKVKDLALYARVIPKRGGHRLLCVAGSSSTLADEAQKHYYHYEQRAACVFLRSQEFFQTYSLRKSTTVSRELETCWPA